MIDCRSLRVPVALLAAILAGAPSGCAPPAASEPRAEDGRGEGEETLAGDDWRDLDRLIDERRYQAASEVASRLLAAAREAGDEAAWTRVLVRLTQLRIALGGFETAVEQLREESWPEGGIERTVLELFYAHGLSTYLRAYSWEIGQRERVASVEEAPLESWTRDQIAAEAHRAFDRAWARREAWGDRSLGALAEHLEQNDYPARIRGTLRDAVTYLWVEMLADTALWRPEHESGVWRLDPAALLAGPAGSEIDLVDPSVHPLEKIAVLLGDLESWHRAGERPEAAFEARLERLRRLRASFDRPDDHALLAAHLEKRLEALGRRYPWWSMGRALLAEWVRQEEAPDALVRALELAREGERLHRDSIGGERCRHLARSIEAPEFELESMLADGAGRRSLEVEHRNLPRLHFRAIRLDLDDELGRPDSPIFGRAGRAEQIVEMATPAAEWTVELPPTPDYRSHRTFVTPPLERPGVYLVAASAAGGFPEEGNRVLAVPLVVTDLVLLAREEGRRLEAEVRSGDGGEVVAGVAVELWEWEWQGGHRRLATRTSERQGRVRFEVSRRGRHFLVARDGERVALLAPRYRGRSEAKDEEQRSALIYTDRSVYRPGQEVLWKVVAYAGRAADGRFRTLPGASVTVQMVDANGEEVEATTVRTGDYGSASGAFRVPAGRMLGGWSLATSVGGWSSIQVEEYKRPTFEVELSEPVEALRLNRPATLRGEARYYFGLPVPSGQVAWRITREPIFPRWWFWRPPRRQEVLAAGEERLGADGAFEIGFLPEADERLAERPGVSFRFRLSVDVTDDGGETRSAARSFRLGFVAVEAAIELERGFERAGRSIPVEIVRRDLDGAPRAGAGSWRLAALEQPETTPLPADLPVDDPPDGAAAEAYRTPGDRLRPRWTTAYSPERVLATWAAGETLAGGELAHGEDGLARLELGALPAGVYRLSYETVDPFGAAFEVARELVVVGEEGPGLALPAVLELESGSAEVGDTARLLVHSGLAGREMVLDVFYRGRRIDQRRLLSTPRPQIVELPVQRRHRGGLGFTLTCLADHQLMTLSRGLRVPWSDRQLEVSFGSFRDRLRPGGRETWTLEVRSDSGELLAGGAELLAYMYDRSLDLFAAHLPPDPLQLYPVGAAVPEPESSLGSTRAVWRRSRGFAELPDYPTLREDRLKFLDGYGIGGPGRTLPMRRMVTENLAFEAADTQLEEVAAAPPPKEVPIPGATPDEPAPDDAGRELRSDFAETAFFEPHLLIGADGTVQLEFEVPDSVTEWSVWAHAVTRDLAAGRVERTARTVKELLVRPYLPRFLREGDRATIAVLVQNAGEEELAGTLDLALEDPATGEDLLAAFGVEPGEATGLPFRAPPGGSARIEIELEAPRRLGEVAVRVEGRAGPYFDGELRGLPVLPGRMHLSGSRFAALDGAERRELAFPPFAAAEEDPSFAAERLVVTLDGQLFYAMLRAVPYLVEYPYECTEQLLNRFLSTGILSSLFDRYPAVAAMAEEMAGRETRYETWDELDPNRKMALEETPWLEVARGGDAGEGDLVKVLDPRVARAEREASLAKLVRAQAADGGFPWWPGGPSSPYMTLYLLQGFARAVEHGVEVPRASVERAWGYLHRYWTEELVREALGRDCCWEMVTFLGYVLSSYPDDAWTGGRFDAAERARMLDFSFRHWREHSPLLKAQLALALHRAGRTDDGMRLLESLLDSAKTTRDEGTFWMPEERSWLWYNDSVEGHAFALSALAELAPDDARRHGLVQWLFLNRKLDHWKSTRATAEALYALAAYLEGEGTLAARQAATVEAGPVRRRFVFEPDRYGPVVPHGEALAGPPPEGAGPAGRANQVVLPGDRHQLAELASVAVEQETEGLLFASATWHFSTERLPEGSEGDLLAVERRFFKRQLVDGEWTLAPLAEGARLEVGDQVEVQLEIRARHAAEYVHLRDPRGAGFEPETLTSGYRWDLGIGRFEEIRDSGTNFFIEWLPAGTYTLKHRLRAATAGAFRAAPATLQSMYAPEFTGYSSGARLEIAPSP